MENPYYENIDGIFAAVQEAGLIMDTVGGNSTVLQARGPRIAKLPGVGKKI